MEIGKRGSEDEVRVITDIMKYRRIALTVSVEFR